MAGKDGTQLQARVDPYWTSELLDRVLHLLTLDREPVLADELAHRAVTGHSFQPKHEWTRTGKCRQCGDKEVKGDSLARTVRALAGVAEQGSPWTRIVFGQEFLDDEGDERIEVVLVDQEGENIEWVLDEEEGENIEWVLDEEEGVDASRGAFVWTLNLAPEFVDEISEQRARDLLEAPQRTRKTRLSIPAASDFWPEERLERLTQMADELQREGDLAPAAELIYGIIPEVERWRMMRIVEEHGSRRVLKDYAGSVWVAVPLADVQVKSQDEQSSTAAPSP